MRVLGFVFFAPSCLKKLAIAAVITPFFKQLGTKNPGA